MSIATHRQRSVFSKNIATFRQDPMLLFTLLIVGFLLVVFILFPLFKVLTLSVTGSGTFSLSEFRYIFEQWWLQTFQQHAVGVIRHYLPLSGISAYAFARTSMRGRWFFRLWPCRPCLAALYVYLIGNLALGATA